MAPHSPGVQRQLAEATLTAPTIPGLGFPPDVAKSMAHPEAKMNAMGIFSPDRAFINPMRPGPVEKYNQVFVT